MTQLSDRLNIKELSVVERLQLVGDIWDGIAAEQESLEITEAQRIELKRRLDEYRSSGEKGSSWESIKNRLQTKG